MAGEEATLSTESIASPQPPASGSPAPACPACGSPLAGDQRYCLECGERQTHLSEFLRVGPPLGSSPPARPPQAPPAAGRDPDGARNNTVSLLAGVGVLLLALGVGVLIGRSGGSSKQTAAPVQVVTQPAGGATGPGAEQQFKADWPGGRKGYTIELQTLPVSGTTVAAVQAAKTAAAGKGAGSVGVLKSSEFTSLGGETYVVYSGIYHKRSEAQKALVGLKKKFPAAKVVEVSKRSSSGSSGSASSPAAARKKLAPGVGKSLSKPAPPSVLQGPNSAKGKKAEEESKNIPNVVSTG